MIVDSSALVAVAVREPLGDWILDRITATREASIGAPSVVEVGLVLVGRFGPPGRSMVSRLIEKTKLTVVGFDAAHAAAASDAFLRFGKGRHPARLNLGDCMTYAVAKLAGEPLLCLGDDFAKTDLELAV